MNRLLTIILVLCGCGVLPACAATNSWNGGDGSWDSQNNWSLHQRPNSGQDIVITNAGTFTATIDDKAASQFPATMTVLSLTVSNDAGESTLLLTNRPMSNTSMLFRVLGDIRFDSGSMLDIGSANVSNGMTIWASNLFYNSSLLLSTNVRLITGRLTLGSNPNQVGSVTNSGGFVTASDVILGDASGAMGSWTIMDGWCLVGNRLQIGSVSGTGRVERLGGKLLVAGAALAIGEDGVIVVALCSDYDLSIAGCANTNPDPNSAPTIVLANGTLNPGTMMAIGEGGFGRLIVSNGVIQAQEIDVGVRSGSHGRFDIAGGTNTFGSRIRLGPNTGSTGEVWLTGGLLQTPSDTLLGDSGGVGSLTISNGTLQTRGLGIGESLGSVGTVTIAGGSVTAEEITLSDSGRGVLWQTGGELVVTGAPIQSVRVQTGGTLISSGGVLRASEVSLIPRSDGNSLWSIAGGTSIVNVAVALASDETHVSVLTMSGGRLETPILNFGTLAGGGAVTISGGEIQVTHRLHVGLAAGMISVVDINGGSLKLAGPSFVLPAFIGAGGTGVVNVSSGSFTANEIWVGGPAGSVGTLTVSGGLVDGGTGSFGLGTILLVGEEPGSTGLVSYTGGNLHTRTITLGEAGYGSMSVGSNADFQPLGVRVAHQSGSVGTLSLTGGDPFGSPNRVTSDLEIGMAAASTGTVWVTDGVLRAGYSCFPDGAVIIGGSGSGRLSATNAFLVLLSPTIGNKGTLESVNSQFIFDTSSGCPTLNSSVMLFVNSTGTFLSSFQNPGIVTASGSTLTFYGPVDNSGTIITTNGTVQFLGGINNTGNVVFGPDQFLITSAVRSNNDVVISWRAFGGNRYRVQAAADVSAVYADISPEIVAAGSGFSVTNYVDVGGATNFPSRIYRVRQVF